MKRKRPAFTLGIHFNEQGILEVYSVDGEDGPDDVAAPFMSLLEDWIAGNAIDGELHPYLDDTLNMLAMLTHAQQVIVQHLEADDPHRLDMSLSLNEMAVMLQSLQEQVR